MKKLLLIPALLFLLLLINCAQSGTDTSIVQIMPSDSIDVSARLKPNEDYIVCRHTYGKDSIVGNQIIYRLATDSSSIFVDFDITTLELHPAITANLLSFIHSELLSWNFIDSCDTITPFDIKELTTNGLTQNEIVRKALDRESDLFYNELPTIIDYGPRGYEMSIEIYPIFLNEDYVTYRKYYYAYTGGAHGNYATYFQTFNRKTGKIVNLDDIIKPDKMDCLRQRVAYHMAANYPIYSPVTDLDSYIDSLNRWLGLTDLGTASSVNTQEPISLKNYPMNLPGVHGAGLLFYYERYALAPGVCGCPIVLVTYDEIRDCLKEPFCNYYADISEFKKMDPPAELARSITAEQLDSIREACGPSDNGKYFPQEIYDQYQYYRGDLKCYYTLNDFVGTWTKYGHLYDDRQILSLNPDGTFTNITEEATCQDSRGVMQYHYKSTIKGKYTFDPQTNTLMFKNWRKKMELNTETLDWYIKSKDPENHYVIIHSIDTDTMYFCDDCGDLSPLFRTK